MPKQFVPLLGTQSTFQQTLERVADRGLFGRPVIATNDAYRFMAEQQAKDIGMEIDILVEPSRRDSGPAMAAAAAYARNQGAKAVLALASDHLVIGAEEFRAACREGLLAVQQGGIVTFGIPPTEPKTDYGYIRPGSEQIGPVLKVAAFVEKPNAQTALRYIAEGLLWNSGNFLFPPELLLAEMARFEPAMAAAAEEAVAKAKKTGSTVFLDADSFAKAPAKSIDYAVMERARGVRAVPLSAGWSDVGSWSAVRDLRGSTDGRGNLVVSERPVLAPGVRDTAIVVGGEGVLVLPFDSEKELHGAVERLRGKDGAGE